MHSGCHYVRINHSLSQNFGLEVLFVLCPVELVQTGVRFVVDKYRHDVGLDWLLDVLHVLSEVKGHVAGAALILLVQTRLQAAQKLLALLLQGEKTDMFTLQKLGLLRVTDSDRYFACCQPV